MEVLWDGEDQAKLPHVEMVNNLESGDLGILLTLWLVDYMLNSFPFHE